MTTHTKDEDAIPRTHETFLGLPPDYCDAATARFDVFPAGYESESALRPGMGAGAAAILEASRHVALFDVETGRDAHIAGIFTHAPRRMRSFQALYKALQQDAAASLSAGRVPVVLGGEHIAVIPFVHAALERTPGLTVLHFGARPDLRESFHGAEWTHACAMRRLLTITAPPPRIVGLALRGMTRAEWDLARRLRTYTPLLARDIFSGRVTYTKVLAALGSDVFLSLDLDGFDPAAAPAVGLPEPGGPDWDWTTGLLAHIAEKKRIAGFAVFGLCPAPANNVTDMLAAKLAYRIMGLMS